MISEAMLLHYQVLSIPHLVSIQHLLDLSRLAGLSVMRHAISRDLLLH